MKKRWISLICFVLLVIISVSIVLAVLLRTDSVEAQQSVGCEQRNFGHDSFVCVCNVTYCDSFTTVAPGAPGLVTTYQSDREVNRFAIGQLQFSKNTLDVEDGVVVTIERDQKFQTLFGFGGSFSDSAGLNIDKLQAKLGKNIIKDYYGNSGLKYSMGRVPIGGSDFSTRAYTYDDSDVEDFDLTNWKLQPEDIQYKIPYIQQALQEATNREIKLIASPWSPPAWMKTNNQLNGKGELKGDPTGIYYKTWADYFVKFLEAYRKHDIQFWGITVQNEPLDGTIENFAFNALGMTAAQQRDFVFKTLGPKLNSSGYGKDKLQLMIMDDQRTLIKHWADTILSQEEAKQFVSGIAYHWYMNPFSPPELLDEIHEKYPDFFLVSSEACIGSSPFDRNKVELGSWTRAESYAYDIIHDLQHHTTSWLDWNLALDTSGGPNWVGNNVDAPILINATAQEYYKNPMYYALAHFTRFLESGSVRLGITQNRESLEVTVFSTPSKSTVAVVLNRYQSQILLQINDPKYGAIRTTMDAHSIKTFVWFD